MVKQIAILPAAVVAMHKRISFESINVRLKHVEKTLGDYEICRYLPTHSNVVPISSIFGTL